MFHPVRGGTRGGAAYFSWDDVRKDKDRENYLGHSVLAPTGRWQKNKDVNWYNKEKGEGEEAETSKEVKRKEELLAIRQKEEEEINKRLGIKGDLKQLFSSTSHISGPSKLNKSKEKDEEIRKLESNLSREDRRAAKKLAKMQVRQQRREESHGERRSSSSHHREEKRRRHRDERDHPDRDRSRSRSRSPQRRDDRERTSKSEYEGRSSRHRNHDYRHSGRSSHSQRYDESDRRQELNRDRDHHSRHRSDDRR